MSGFVKIDENILTSSLWVERDLRSVFLTALFMAEPHEVTEPTPQLEVRSLMQTGWMVPPGWYGLVRAAGTAIVRLDGCEKEVGLRKLEELCAPDPDSRSQGFEGRRMARIDGGYLILNYMQYRDRDYNAAERMRRLRERRKGLTPDVTANSDGVTANVTDAESREQMAEAEELPSLTPARETIHRWLEARAYESTEWTHLLDGYLNGLGTPGGKAATREQIALACNEADVLGGDMSPRRFRRILGQIMEKPQPPIKNPATGKMIRAGEIIDLIRAYKPPQPPPQTEKLVEGKTGRLEREATTEAWVPPPPAWRDKLSQREVRAVNAIGVQQITTTPEEKRSILLGQLAKALAEAEA